MIKTLQTILKQDREKFAIPRSVQDAIPIRQIWPDGIFLCGSKFSKTIRFSDINYAIASKEDKTSMFLRYSELLNALDTGSTTKITINNKRLNRQNFEHDILLPNRNDGLDGYRSEYNSMLMDKVTGSSNSVVQERYITLSVHRKNVEEARTIFDRVTNDVSTRLSRLDVQGEELDAEQRLRVLHDFYRVGEETNFRFDFHESMRKGHSYKDIICPDSMEFRKDHFVMGNKYGRVLFLKEYTCIAIRRKENSTMARRNAAKSPSKKNAPTGRTSYTSKYALSERLVCGECGTLYRRCTWVRKGQKRTVWRCVSRLDYGTKYCHDSPTLDEEPLQRAILAAINKAMSSPDDLIHQITEAMEKEVSPLPGQLISLADVDRRLNDLEVQFNTLLEQAAEQTDGLDCMERFQAINQEITALKKQRTQIECLCKNSDATAQRMNRVASILESASPELRQWDEAVIRQLVDTVKVLSAEKIIVYLRGGMEIEQDITK